MLVLSRKKGESIIIDEQIEVKIVSIEGDTIKLGIEAPKHISIHRQEIHQAIQQENRLASRVEFDFKDLRKFMKEVD